ncbi:MAG: metallopeptidase TldD-related protein [Desulfurococcaceae archaeon]
MAFSFTDRVKYYESIVEVALRDGCFEINRSSNSIKAIRSYVEGCFSVASSTDEDYEVLKSKLSKAPRHLCRSEKWFNETISSGEFRVGEEVHEDDLRALAEVTYEMLVERGVKGEVIASHRRVIVEHSVEEYSVTAVEKRSITELYIYPYALMYGTLASTGSLTAALMVRDIYDELTDIVDGLVNNLKHQLVAKRFNPMYSGHWKIILSGEASPAVFHELAHLLQGDEPVKLRIGMNLREKVSIVEDPFYPGPLQRVFDDELYPAWRRTLVEDGSIVDYLHTRMTVFNEAKPGNARGLFTRSKPLHHQLIVKKGDWSIDEMIDVAKRALIVRSIARAEVGRDYIRLIPEAAVISERDKLTPTKALEILIPLSRLDSIFIGLAKDKNARYTYEKQQPVYEVAPTILVEARVIT